ncbi:MAG: hypothetical protein IKY83_14460 [Proteobacteria bacterium]|nr:hypothetical protein [Pseudomonadota bacterium]
MRKFLRVFSGCCLACLFCAGCFEDDDSWEANITAYCDYGWDYEYDFSTLTEAQRSALQDIAVSDCVRSWNNMPACREERDVFISCYVNGNGPNGKNKISRCEGMAETCTGPKYECFEIVDTCIAEEVCHAEDFAWMECRQANAEAFKGYGNSASESAYSQMKQYMEKTWGLDIDDYALE